MRMLPVAAIAALGFTLSGCAVAEVGGMVVDAGATVVGTAVDVTGDVIGTVTGSPDKDKKPTN